MPVKTETEVLEELERLLEEAARDIAAAKTCLKTRQRQECTDACLSVQRKMQRATKLMLGVEKS